MLQMFKYSCQRKQTKQLNAMMKERTKKKILKIPN